MASLFERYLFDIDVDIAIGKTLYPFADIALTSIIPRQDEHRMRNQYAIQFIDICHANRYAHLRLE